MNVTELEDAIARYKEQHGLEVFNPKTVLFDMDGVLYDSMPNHAIAWHETMEDYGLKMSTHDAFLYEGMRGIEVIQLIAKEQWGHSISDDEATKMYHTKTQHYIACGLPPQIPDVHRLQEYFHNEGLLIGIVTGSGQPSLLQRVLNDFDGLVNPKIMVTANDVNRGKPEPDPYIMGMQKATKVLHSMGKIHPNDTLKPWETIVIENAPLGVKAAKAANCFTIAINTGPLEDSILQEAGADITLPDMATAIEQFKKMK